MYNHVIVDIVEWRISDFNVAYFNISFSSDKLMILSLFDVFGYITIQYFAEIFLRTHYQDDLQLESEDLKIVVYFKRSSAYHLDYKIKYNFLSSLTL